MSSWFLYLLSFISGSLIFGGTIAFVAWKKIRSLKTDRNGDNPKWQFADVQSILAFVIVFAFIGVVGTFLYKPPTVNEILKDVLLVLVGNLSSKFGDVYAFYFNSTAQTKALTETARMNAETASKTADATTTMAAVITGTGAGALPPVVSPPTKQQLFDAAAGHFTKGDYTEDQFRATLKTIGYVNGEIESAVQQYKPKKD